MLGNIVQVKSLKFNGTTCGSVTAWAADVTRLDTLEFTVRRNASSRGLHIDRGDGLRDREQEVWCRLKIKQSIDLFGSGSG